MLAALVVEPLEVIEDVGPSVVAGTEFRRLTQQIIADDLTHDHMPSYSLTIDGDMVEMKPKAKDTPTLPGLFTDLL